MINLGLLLTNQYRLLSSAAILDVFKTVNNLFLEQKQTAPFQISLIYSDDDNFNHQLVFPGYQLQSLHSGTVYDLILIPAFANDHLEESLQKNREEIKWLKGQYEGGAALASFCTGAFILGATGLLDHKIATTHVDASAALARFFPKIKVEAEKTVTQDGRLFTSGGATSSFHLMLFLIQQYCGKEVTVRIAKFFAIDMDRRTQSYFNTFQISHHHHDELVAMAQQKIENAYHNTGTIEEMIKDIPASRRNIARRFKLVTGITPIAYLQQTRIEAAKKLLEQTAEQMTEVIFKTGYSDPKAFRKVFRKTVGMTPTEYREKFYVGG